MNLLALTGFAFSRGHSDTPMEERAATNTYGDYIVGTIAAAILAALYHRTKTGEGQYIEVSQTEATASVPGVLFLCGVNTIRMYTGSFRVWTRKKLTDSPKKK